VIERLMMRPNFSNRIIANGLGPTRPRAMPSNGAGG
jgi:hypothetical protein